MGGGAVIAALALGVLLTHRASGVINFAHAAIGTYIAFAYNELRQTGDLVLPILGLPDRVRVVGCAECVPATAMALPIALGLAAILGLVIYLLIFRPLRHAPALARVVASLGLFLYLLAIVGLRFGAQGAALRAPEPILPNSLVTVAGIDIQQDRLWLAGIVVVTSLMLGAVYRFTGFGLATRAASENEKGAVLLGRSPELLAAVNWMIASVLAGGAVILFAPISRLDPALTSLLIVPALAACLLGRFESFLVTVAAGLAIGMVQSELLNLQTEITWLPDVGLQQGVPFVIILVTMIVRGESLPTRGTITTGRFPRSPRPTHLLPATVALSAIAMIGLLTLDSTWRAAITISLIFALLSLSCVVLTGYVGQISLAPMAFAGVAAFSMVKLTDAGVPFPVAPLLGAVVALGVGLLVGIPAVRLRGMNLAIATLAAAAAIEELVFKWSWFTGGLGGTDVPRPSMLGIDLGYGAAGDGNARPAFGIVCIVVLVASSALVANLRRGATGLQWLSVRANERAAASSGIDVARAKLLAFAASSFLAGLGGTLLAYQRQTLSVDSFQVFNSLALLSITYLGGIASITGAMLAGLFADGGALTVAMGSSEGSQHQFAINGLLLIAVAVLYPEGVAGALHRVVDRVRRLVGRSASLPAAPRAA